MVNRLQQRGYDPVPPENLYWAEKGVTFEDPDGWRVVLDEYSGNLKGRSCVRLYDGCFPQAVTKLKFPATPIA